MILLVLAPAAVILAALSTTHVFIPRYVAWSLVGAALLCATVINRSTRGNALVGVAVLATVVVSLATLEIVRARKWNDMRESEAMRAALSSLPEGAAPIVIPNFHSFMELSYYAKPNMSGRILYPICGEFDLRYLGYDSNALVMAALSRWTKANVEPCEAVLNPPGEYFVAARKEDYLPWLLVKEGRAVTPLDSGSQDVLLFHVAADKPSRPQAEK